MVERQEHIPLWMEAVASGKIDKDALREALHGYKAGLDLPFSGWCVGSFIGFTKHLLYYNIGARS